MLGTWMVSIFLIVVVSAIIISMRKNKQKGKSVCGGDCSKCRGCH